MSLELFVGRSGSGPCVLCRYTEDTAEHTTTAYKLCIKGSVCTERLLLEDPSKSWTFQGCCGGLERITNKGLMFFPDGITVRRIIQYDLKFNDRDGRSGGGVIDAAAPFFRYEPPNLQG
ncbi:unnamed protein product [Macrosiphum euphorbiae]|uniref:Uncharacterized protein n=1 Tax=Macrosiphum euphorbiae TaxID=13131 RepID=A0AAV0XJB0_9HEMI|nr:unnamed protein product [Macrosiphum euphorbiae]